MTEPLFTGFNHFCVVTNDLDRAVSAWTDRYGVGPWELRTFDEEKIRAEVDGAPTPFGMRVAMAQLGPHAKIELIQPLDDRSLYAASLARHGGADHLHHLRLEVEDFDGARGGLEGLGLPKLLDGHFAGGRPGTASQAIYFDTQDELGFIAEIADIPEGFERLQVDEIRGA